MNEQFNKLQQQVGLAQQVQAQSSTPTDTRVQGLLDEINQEQATPDFNVGVPDVVDVTDLGQPDSIGDLQSRLDSSAARVKELSQPTQAEIELGAKVGREDLQSEQAQRQLYGQGMMTPLSLLQGEQRKLQEQRAFERAFDVQELDLLERSRDREMAVARGELDSIQAEAEQAADIKQTNDSLVERMASSFQGTSLQEIQQSSPETYSKLIGALANSSYTLGELEQELKAPQSSVQYREVNGNLVALDKQGNVVKTIGKAGGSGDSGSGVGEDYGDLTKSEIRDAQSADIFRVFTPEEVAQVESIAGFGVEDAYLLKSIREYGTPAQAVINATREHASKIKDGDIKLVSEDEMRTMNVGTITNAIRKGYGTINIKDPNDKKKEKTLVLFFNPDTLRKVAEEKAQSGDQRKKVFGIF